MEISKHTLSLPSFDKIVDDALSFFNSSPLVSLSELESFEGVGIYALFYVGDLDLYIGIYEEKAELPIYVGKAVPPGNRQGRKRDGESKKLYGRLKEHLGSIDAVDNLNPEDFLCKFVIVSNDQSDIIGTYESATIRQFQPLWNAIIDGFGNHDPGSGRHGQAKSDWDIIHPGRSWADNLTGNANPLESIKEKIYEYKNPQID